LTVLRSGSASDVGRVRTVNQDLPLERPNLYAVADGMGGHVGGEVAARVAVETLSLAFERVPTVEGLREAFSEANAAVWHESQINNDLRGMGTTLTAVALVGGSEGHDVLALANVGDSRAYVFSGGELPESYGTKKLFLTARDPHWLYANWDLTPEQQKELNAASTDGHLILRIYAGKIEGHPAYEIHVHPESRHWFAHVERAGNSYAAELGYYSALGKWIRIAVSSGTLTPPDAASAEAEAEFATIPFEFPFAKLMQIIEEAVRDNLPLAVAIEELRRHGHPDLPRFSSSGLSSVAPAPSSQPGPERVWTPEQERALARVINIDQTRRIWMGSLEITELIRRRVSQDTTSPMTAFGAGLPGAVPVPGGASSVTSPFGGQAQKPKGFWFSVNAELVIYGATDPDAKVTLGGHLIKLRPDGTFSFRFALPDGEYDLPAEALSADGTDGRAAELRFNRSTKYRGEVGAVPQDPSLKPPVADHL